MSEEFIGATELIRHLGITRGRLNYLQDLGLVETPRKNFAGHRVYSRNDVRKITKIERELKMKRKSKNE